MLALFLLTWKGTIVMSSLIGEKKDIKLSVSSDKLKSDIFSGLVSLRPSSPVSQEGIPGYIFCNETDQEMTLSKLNACPIDEKATRLHIGFSLWFNFNIVANRHSDAAIIIDIDPKVLAVLELLKLAVLKSDTPETFCKLFSAELAKYPYLQAFPNEYFAELLLQETKLEHGFLYSQELFSHIKKLFHQNKIFFAEFDARDNNAVDLLVKWIRENDLYLDTLYLSNIAEWLLQSGDQDAMKKFATNLTTLIAKNTICIDAFYPDDITNKVGPPQRVTIGSAPSFVKTAKKKKRKTLHDDTPSRPRKLHGANRILQDMLKSEENTVNDLAENNANHLASSSKTEKKQ